MTTPTIATLICSTTIQGDVGGSDCDGWSLFFLSSILFLSN